MAERLLDINLKNKPGINFKVFFPIKFSISSSVDLSSRFREYFKNKHGGMSAQLNSWFFEMFNAKNVEDLLSKNKNIRRKTTDLKNETRDEGGLSSNELSLYFREKIEKFLKVQEKKNEKIKGKRKRE